VLAEPGVVKAMLSGDEETPVTWAASVLEEEQDVLDVL
jgi:hypothetical protein